MPSTLCACSKLRRSARIISAFYDKALEPSGLTVAQFALLRTLRRTGPATLTDFAAATGHDRTTLNRTLRPLQEEGLVASAPGKDRRARIVDLTESGRQAIRRAHPHWEQAQKKVEEQLGGGQGPLFALLDRVEELRA